jgi:hypothetical protein
MRHYASLWDGYAGEDMETDKAVKYREHAADCLEAARTENNYRIRQNLISIAQSWQRLAQQIEERTQTIESQRTQPDMRRD